MTILYQGLNSILNFFVYIVNFILTPINNGLSALIPNFNDYLHYINTFISWLDAPLQFILSWLNIPTDILALIVTYYFLRVMFLLTLNTSKLIFRLIFAIFKN